MRRPPPYWLLAGCLMLALLGCGRTAPPEETRTERLFGEKGKPPTVSALVGAGTLARRYADENAADGEFKGKEVVVWGPIKRVDAGGSVGTVELEGDGTLI